MPPIAALREGAVPPPAAVAEVTAAGALLGLVGIALMVVGLFGDLASNAALSFVGGGAGADVPRRRVGQPVPRPAARLGRRRGRSSASAASPGDWRARTPCANPGRTAVTAAALMVGVALVTFVSIFAAGAKETIAKAVDDNLKAAFVVQNTDGFSPFSAAVLPAVRRSTA